MFQKAKAKIKLAFKAIGALFGRLWRKVRTVFFIVLVAAIVLGIALPSVIVGFRIGWQARGFNDKIEKSPFVQWLKPKAAPAQTEPQKEKRLLLVPEKRPPNEK